ncbi:uncharacterized protein LOC114245087 [Bombyx mandarina]|uniref:Uncharacterized protein LOC114245087 n=1 Tax=Bombyx mandarina TaxID=7092 RepID=A0A6J2JTH9_BOMMA|nr:uncharacterized protein LOC114245087 [Bombyx mandarina]
MNYDDDTDLTAGRRSLSHEAEGQKIEHEFIKLYHKLPLLWDAKHPDYNNKYKRNAALDKLLIILKQLNHLATRYNVRQKINILRSCYRKDLRRHLASKVIGADGEVSYEHIPTSWKFHKLRFLDGNDNNTEEYKNEITQVNIQDSEYHDNSNNSNQRSEGSSGQECHDIETDPDLSLESLKTFEDKTYIRKSSHKRIKLELNQEGYYPPDKEEPLDREFNAIGANVACKLKRMNQQQRYHAELLINKVLIKGLKDSLTDDSDITDVWNV